MPTVLKRLIYIILFQILIYSFFTEWLISLLDNTPINYYLELIVFIFLFIPLFLINQNKEKRIFYEIHIKSILPFTIFYILLPILHFLILFKYEIFNRRIGTETIALIYGDMNGLDKFFMKIYDNSQFAYLIICFYILRFNKKFQYRSIFKFVYLINFFYVIIFSLFNSRASLIIFILLFYIVDGFFLQISKKLVRKLLFFGISFFVIVSSIRYIPLMILENVQIKDIVKNEIIYRANCSRFFNEVYEATSNKGFLYGETITTPFLSLSAIMGSENAKDKIRNAETGSKQYILNNFLYKDNKDDCSCAVVDSYVNFGIVGIIFLTLIYFVWLLFLYKLMHFKYLKTHHFLMIIIFIFSILLYEIDGFSILFSFIKFIPIIIIYFIFNPVNFKRVNIEK